MTIALYPGSFDPMTYGHLDIVTRASRLFERVVVAAFDRPNKKLLFDVAERVELLRIATQGLPNVEVTSYSILTVQYAQQIGAGVMVRGLRAGDFEHELLLAQANQTLAPEIEVVALMTPPHLSFVSSSIVRDIAAHGGDVSAFVPPHVAAALARHTRPA